jgi:hypothetical protein
MQEKIVCVSFALSNQPAPNTLPDIVSINNDLSTAGGWSVKNIYHAGGTESTYICFIVHLTLPRRITHRKARV